MTTNDHSLRSEADGWSCEDSDLYVLGRPVGMTPGPKFRYTFENPLQAMAMGWELMAPPQAEKMQLTDGERTIWIWYFSMNFKTVEK